MTGKSTFKWIKSLQLKKYRLAEQCFMVQGWKGVEMLLTSRYEVVLVAATAPFIPRVEVMLKGRNADVLQVSPTELEALGSFQSNDSVLAVARMNAPVMPVPGEGPLLVLDDIRDPGNMGTIIRTADWFGIRHIAASAESVEFYNPKVISATMGSFCRVNVWYGDLVDLLKDSDADIYGAFLGGTDIREMRFSRSPVLVIGNESSGISPAIAACVDHRVTIPGYGGAESLNA
ncbi:MAG: TrmH family RNA methyltransferase, partial [Bacteroidota bacterium]